MLRQFTKYRELPPVWKNTAFIAVVLAGYLFIWLKPHCGTIDLCLFKRITGIACPGCGGIRTTKALMAMDPVSALQMNPLSVITNLFIILLVILACYGIIGKRDMLSGVFNKRWNKLSIAIVFLLIGCQWIWNIYRGI
ncbi:MAG: DUF2752 domain-containing protein [Rikenellaceae bacterium]|nr:DUF2752 domain-containing protein [Rikenellaceae bacterium]